MERRKELQVGGGMGQEIRIGVGETEVEVVTRKQVVGGGYMVVLVVPRAVGRWLVVLALPKDFAAGKWKQGLEYL